MSILCALATCVFASVSPTRTHALFMATGFLAAAFWLSGHPAPDIASIAGSILFVSALAIAKPRLLAVQAISAGVLGGAWLSLLRADGVPLLAAAAAAIALPAVSGYLSSSRASFAPQTLREEAMLLVLALAAAVAAAPALADGWRSAAALNAQQPGAAPAAMPGWTLALAASAIGLGGLVSVWRRG